MPEEATAPNVPRYELKITATGIVRDAEGNIVQQQPVEATQILTEDEIRAQIERGQTTT
jgi:hypothetical protein